MSSEKTLKRPAKGHQDSQTGARGQAALKSAYASKSVLFKPRFKHAATYTRDAEFVKSDN
jgi:hypothetical protein